MYLLYRMLLIVATPNMRKYCFRAKQLNCQYGCMFVGLRGETICATIVTEGMVNMTDGERIKMIREAREMSMVIETMGGAQADFRMTRLPRQGAQQFVAKVNAAL